MNTQEQIITREIVRLTTNRDLKAGFEELQGIHCLSLMIIDMLCRVLLEELSQEDMIDIIKDGHPQIFKYYTEFFKQLSELPVE